MERKCLVARGKSKGQEGIHDSHGERKNEEERVGSEIKGFFCVVVVVVVVSISIRRACEW
jgi:hypothetical protein